jgi:hypothetical protein
MTHWSEQKSRTIQLTAQHVRWLEREVCDDLEPALKAAIEQHLTGYANTPRITGADVKRWQAQGHDRLTTARHLLHLLEHASLEDDFEAEARGQAQSVLREQLARRIAQWEARQLSAPRGGAEVD